MYNALLKRFKTLITIGQMQVTLLQIKAGLRILRNPAAGSRRRVIVIGARERVLTVVIIVMESSPS